MTLLRQRIEVDLPRKRHGDSTQHNKGLQKFFETILQALLNPNNVDFSVIKCLIVASPGFVKDQFYDYISAEVILALTFSSFNFISYAMLCLCTRVCFKTIAFSESLFKFSFSSFLFKMSPQRRLEEKSKLSQRICPKFCVFTHLRDMSTP